LSGLSRLSLIRNPSTGASGYIGGQVLHTIVNAFPDLTIRALARDSAKADAIIRVFPKVQIVQGALDDLSLIQEEAKNADIILSMAYYNNFTFHIATDSFLLDLASTKHIDSVQAIHEGLKGRGANDKPGIFFSSKNHKLSYLTVAY
jgi:hypothetical protein